MDERTGRTGPAGAGGPGRAGRDARLRVIEELVSARPVTSQRELGSLLEARGFAVDAATVSRDLATLGLVKVMRDGRRVYALPGAPSETGRAGGSALRRLLDDLPITVRRSGLTLLLITLPGMASALAQAIDLSELQEQEGTLAGENTVLVLFADEARMASWRERFDALRGGGEREGRG